MIVGGLTAGLQQPMGLTLADFKSAPIESARTALNWWIDSAPGMGLQALQVADALSPINSYIPAESMLDPLGKHLPMDTAPDGSGTDLSDEDANAINQRAKEKGIRLSSIGFFENHLHHDTEIRKQTQTHLLRCMKAAVKLKPSGCKAVTSFIGRNTKVSVEENLRIYEAELIPILKQFAENGITFLVENCPMPGWTPQDLFIQNIACTPQIWVLLKRIAEKHGVGHVIMITHDPSHDILMGTTPALSYAFVKACGYGADPSTGRANPKHQLMGNELHVKEQRRKLDQIAAHTILGKRAARGVFEANGKLTEDPEKLGCAWSIMTAEHMMPGVCEYDPVAMVSGMSVDWLDMLIRLQTELGLSLTDVICILEHEWQPGRKQDDDLVTELFTLSGQFIRGIAGAADANVRAKRWVTERGLPWHTFPKDLTAALAAEAKLTMDFKI